MKKKIEKIALAALILILIFFLWWFRSDFSQMGYWWADKNGLVALPVEVSGTGSMYPTFPKGTGVDPRELANQTVVTLNLRRFPGGLALGPLQLVKPYDLQRGDIIYFENPYTASATAQRSGRVAGFMKRVIALPEETIEIRDGFVWVNGQRIDEPYTASARSTFGGTTVQECTPLSVPPGYVFVLGDNRKSSSDSRFDLGFVALSSIERVLPLGEQAPYQGLWRDTTHDEDTANQPTLNQREYLTLINQARQQFGSDPLQLSTQLSEAASKRARFLLQSSNFAKDATSSSYTMQKATQEAGYYNVLTAEAPIQGYFSAEELWEAAQQFPEWENLIISEAYQDVGIGIAFGQRNDCPTQVIVQQFGGYKPAEYDPEVLKSWQELLDVLESVRPGWNQLKDQQPAFYSRHKAELDRLIEIIDIRTTNVRSIVESMLSHQWLTQQQQQYMERTDDELGNEQQRLSTQLNSSL